jgi:hypothetical protein
MSARVAEALDRLDNASGDPLGANESEIKSLRIHSLGTCSLIACAAI